MQDELLDELNEEGNPTGRTISRNLAHKTGAWHASSHIWMYNKRGEVLLQCRASDLYVYPGLYDISVAGHVPAGQNPDQAAVREIFEEIGLKVDQNQLKKVAVVKVLHKMPEKPEFDSREFDHLYLLRFNRDISKLRLQKEEVSGLKYMDIDRFESELSDPVLSKKYVPHSYYPLIIRAIKKELDML